MIRKILFLTLVLTVGITFSNCNEDDDCGSSTTELFFDINDVLGITHIKFDGTGIEDVNEGDSLLLEEYLGLELIFDVTYIASYLESQRSSFSLMNTATACSPIPKGDLGSKDESFTKIDITTLVDFDDTHPANSSLNEIINMQGFQYFSNQTEFVSLQEFLDQEDLVKSEQYFFKPDAIAPEGSNFKVRINIELSTGEKFEVESEEIVLK